MESTRQPQISLWKSIFPCRQRLINVANKSMRGRFSIYTSPARAFRRGRVKNQPSKRSPIVEDKVKEHKITS